MIPHPRATPTDPSVQKGPTHAEHKAGNNNGYAKGRKQIQKPHQGSKNSSTNIQEERSVRSLAKTLLHSTAKRIMLLPSSKTRTKEKFHRQKKGSRPEKLSTLVNGIYPTNSTLTSSPSHQEKKRSYESYSMRQIQLREGTALNISISRS